MNSLKKWKVSGNPTLQKVTLGETSPSKVKKTPQACSSAKIKSPKKRSKRTSNPSSKTIIWRVHQESLISWYQTHPILWDSSLAGFMNKRAKDRLIIDWLKEEEIYNEDNCPDLVSEVQQKFKNLRAQFARQLSSQKIEHSGDGQDDVTETTWEWFEALSFLLKCYKSRQSISNMETSPEMIKTVEQSDYQNQIYDGMDLSTAIENGEIENIVYLVETPQITTPNFDFEETDTVLQKSSESSEMSRTKKSQAKNPSDKKNNLLASCISALNKVSGVKELDDDEQFGRFVVSFLKTLDPHKKEMVKKKFKVLMGETLLE